jgi:hypothetical protein
MTLPLAHSGKSKLAAKSFGLIVPPFCEVAVQANPCQSPLVM